ncbi:hypothetical protein SteCoe_7350 [Stentor coeruleus]|uniref:Uncharacterized protein n=1 Tax=Stentor coeruleus TaxID=5963 RepID=A0A1R2CMT2_9CILI|nr:hypothetical protein SteCoe_7350 [Stentor coeruleus]
MLNFPSYSTLTSCSKIVEKKNLLIEPENSELKSKKLLSCSQSQDTHEELFRKMINHINTTYENIKELQSTNMKQTTLLNQAAMKRKLSLKAKSKEIKFN